MKYELPIAVGLLAIGCLPWFWQSRESSEVSAAVAAPLVADPTPRQQLPVIPEVAFTQSNLSVEPNASAGFLSQIAESFRDGESSFGDLEIENHLVGDVDVTRGRFWCQGMGSRKSRLELIPDSSAAMKLTLVCDGRFFYRLTEWHDQKKLGFFSLDKLNNGDASIIESTLPASWVGSGSIADLFSNVAEAFQFDGVKTSADNQFVEIVGTWKATHLARLMANWVDHREILPTTKWETLPPHIPHGARMRFANVSGRWHPKEVTFFRFDPENADRPDPILLVRFGEIQYRPISAELFQINSDETDAKDETELYNERIDILTGKRRVAEEIGDKIR